MTMKTFDQVLESATPDSVVAAWELSTDSDGKLYLYSVGNAGAHRAADKVVEADQRELVDDQLRAKKIRIGAHMAGTEFVWTIGDDGYHVWSNDALVASGKRASDVKRVITFYDDDDMGHRGVKFGLAGNAAETVVEEHDPAGRGDPTYNRDNLLLDGRWASHLGRTFANWLGVPHVDEILGGGNERDLAAVALAKKILPRVEAAPASGPFEHVIESAGRVDPSGEVAFRFAPNPLEPAKRFLELRVSSPSGKTTSGRWIKQGTNGQIAAFLRDVRTADKIVIAMMDLLRKQEEDGYL